MRTETDTQNSVVKTVIDGDIWGDGGGTVRLRYATSYGDAITP
ncbi:MAG: hypothetical protein Q9M48_01785 [Rhodobacterales bacterium]|nr:hypothetical protein [Rhodobacterales bacterium]